MILDDADYQEIAERVATILADRFPGAEEDRRWLTTEQAREAWGCSRRAVQLRAKRETVESMKEGRLLLVRRWPEGVTSHAAEQSNS